MKRILKRLPSPAMVVACAALAVALGGTSYAAIKLPRNSVGNAQMRNNAVGVKELQRNAVVATKLSSRSVGPAKLQNNAVTTRTLRNNQVTGAKILESSLEKVPSAVAADKAANADAVGGYAVKRFASTVAPNGPGATVLSLNGLSISMTCPSGAVALRANNVAGEGAQLRFDGFAGNTGTGFAGGSGDFVGTTNANLNGDANRGSGSAYYVRANGTGVTVLYGWREDALGGASACRVFGQAISG
jgi:hypothetical protein